MGLSVQDIQLLSLALSQSKTTHSACETVSFRENGIFEPFVSVAGSMPKTALLL